MHYEEIKEKILREGKEMISFGEYIVILIVAVTVAGIDTIKFKFKEKKQA